MSDDENTRKRPIYIYWKMCSQCGYETAAHGRVNCPDCSCGMTASALAGAIVDDRRYREVNDQ